MLSSADGGSGSAHQKMMDDYEYGKKYIAFAQKYENWTKLDAKGVTLIILMRSEI